MSPIHDAVDCEIPVCWGGNPSLTTTVQNNARWMQQLHDGPAQWLALAVLRLDLALESASTASVPLLGNVRALVSEALRGTRHVLEDWSDGVADRPVSLTASLISLGRRLSSLTGQMLYLDCDALISDPPVPVTATVLQAAQELLINTCKHAPGAQVELALVTVADGFELTIRDDGPGFDPVAVCRRYGLTGGLGLGTMSERLARVGATFCLQSRPGAGVHACIRWTSDVAEGDWPGNGVTQIAPYVVAR